MKHVVYGVDFKRVFKSKLVLGIADGWLEADGKRIYTTTDMRVGLFKPEGGLSKINPTTCLRRPRGPFAR